MGAHLCGYCGYDKRSGQRVEEPQPAGPSFGRLASTTVMLALVAAVAYLLFDKFNGGRGGETGTPAPAPVAAAPEPAEASTPTPTTVVAVASAEEAGAAGAVAIDTNAMSETARASLARRIDERFPLFAEGEPVALRLTNGLMRRGTFKGIQASNVVLAAAGGEDLQVPVEALDTSTRLRADTAYRLQYVEYWSRRGMKSAPGP